MVWVNGTDVCSIIVRRRLDFLAPQPVAVASLGYRLESTVPPARAACSHRSPPRRGDTNPAGGKRSAATGSRKKKQHVVGGTDVCSIIVRRRLDFFGSATGGSRCARLPAGVDRASGTSSLLSSLSAPAGRHESSRWQAQRGHRIAKKRETTCGGWEGPIFVRSSCGAGWIFLAPQPVAVAALGHRLESTVPPARAASGCQLLGASH